jgi:uncharacterized ion transporter superfamily protein YfcC
MLAFCGYLSEMSIYGCISTQGYFMAALGILKIPWEKWVRWLLPLLLIWLAVGMAAVIIAQAIHLGPF